MAFQVNELIGNAAKGIESRFCFEGVLNSPSKVELLYKKPSGDWSQHPVVFPGASETDLLNLIQVCSIASFEIDGEDVIDQSYFDALKLDPKNFMTSFQLDSTDILTDISSLMFPDNTYRSSGIQTELYKLNIYSKGGHYKAHVDTPHSPLMFGSLVLCLPLPFTGGSLVTRHQGRQICFDWSSSPKDKVCWASFFSDIEHEVLPVTSGHRVTLTYNLYQNFEIEKVSTFDVTMVPLYTELCTALQTPHFMREGGILGFGCQHAYVMKDLNESKLLSRLLKGSDRLVYSVSKSLGLSVAVAKKIRSRSLVNESNWALEENFDVVVHDIDDERTEEEYMIGSYRNVISTENVHWCHDLMKWELTVEIHNDCVLDPCYQAAAILVGVPKWTTKRSQIGTHQVIDESEIGKVKESKMEETKNDDLTINIDELLPYGHVKKRLVKMLATTKVIWQLETDSETD